MVANIAESILKKKIFVAERGIADIKSIGNIMMELMDPATILLDSNSTVLREPDKWKAGIKDFLTATQYNSLPQLRRVSPF
jgi:hypothetical protein